MNILPLAVAAALVSPATQEGIELRLADEATVALDAFWEPVSEWSMASPGVGNNEVLTNVSPAEAQRTLTASAFAPFLPGGVVAVGDVWQVDSDAILPLLEQFDPGAKSTLHHGPAAIAGTWAALRGVSEHYAEIVTRSHAQFLLEGGIHYTPGQFEGRLVLDRQTGGIVSFRLLVPLRRSNLDVNVPTKESRAMAGNFGMPGIGRIPRMELVSPSCEQEIVWSESISDEEVRLTLRQQFYSAIDWLPFDEAVATAERDEKPLHLVVLLGTYDDESC